MKETDVLVIGAGPSGTIAAAILKKQGYRVQIVEKLQFPRFVIGESLLPRCMEALEEAGLLDAVKAQGFQEKFGAKFVKDTKEICDFNFNEKYSGKYDWTWQVPRADFDKTLADECEKMGIQIDYETEVTDVQIHDDESSVTTVRKTDGTEEKIHARFIIDGSGYGRVIPKLFGLERDSMLPTRESLFVHYVDKNRDRVAQEPNRITIYVYNSTTWVWCIPFSNGVTSLGFVGFPEFFSNLTGTLHERMQFLVQSHDELKERFGDCEMVFEPRELKGWSATTDKFYGNGFVLTGNVTEFLDPMFSSGVTLASVSAQNAAHLVLKKLKGEAVDWETEYMQPCMQGVNVFRTFVMGWYDGDLHTIFFAKNQNEDMRKQICSVLAGYVWDDTNPFVRNHSKQVKTLAHFIRETQGS
ncbi:MAG TPA: NAD(P)/FAD-dependent oxidoreductase [Chitinophagaceae bacterium]|nr:NAD(P)/FAD-dependent oxidoreductase [Chitinophagaceae bacterium]HNF71525.1 NAD(P)/FAD-dependent oxidoreductase [Chitinophagaceae bacterium]